MRVPAPLLLLVCAAPAGSFSTPAFGRFGVGGHSIWRTSESRCAQHDYHGPQQQQQQQQGSGVGLSSYHRALVFAPGRIRPPSVATASSRSGHVLRAVPDDDDEAPEERAKHLKERKEQLRVLLSATKKEIDKLVRNNPPVLKRRNIGENTGKKLALLQERLGIDQKAAGRLCLKANRLLNLSFETLETRVDWLQAKLKINKKQMRTIVTRNPKVLAYSIEENLEPTIDSIQSSLRLGDKELTKMVVMTPDILNFNLSAENINLRLSFLQEVLDLPEGDVASLRKYSKRVPQILFWPEDSMKESQQWIQQRFDLNNARVARVCRNRPQLLYAKTTTLSDKADSIQLELSLSEEELSNLVSKYPSILCFNIEEKIRLSLRYMRTRFELDEEALKNLVLKAPSLFGISEATIEEKLKFYSNLVGEREAKRMVVKSSSLLRQSLEKRLKPRLEEIQKSGVKVRWTETLMRRLAIRTNNQWERYKLGDAPRGGAAKPKEQ